MLATALDGREGQSPKEVAQVRILPGALINPQVSPYFASSSGLHVDHLLARCWQTGPGDGADLDGLDVTIDRQAKRLAPAAPWPRRSTRCSRPNWSATRGPGKGIDDLEVAVAEYVDWFNHRRLHGELGLIPPAEYEANHYRHNTAPTTVGASV